MVLIPAQGWGDPYTKAGGSRSLPSEFQDIQAYFKTLWRGGRGDTQRQRE